MNYAPAVIQLPLVKECSGELVKTPEDVYRVCEDLTQLVQETFQVLCLNSKNRLINRAMVSLGLLDATLVHPREIFRLGIENSAAGLILIHNHPSGDCSPSVDDTRITKQMIEAGKIVDIKILDHVILGGGPGAKYISMREDGVCRF